MIESATAAALEPSRYAARAAAYQATLDAGLVSTAAVIAWADAVIAREASPHWALCDLALLGSRTAQAVVEALKAVEGPREPALVEAFAAADVLAGLSSEPGRSTFYAEIVEDLGEENVVTDERLLDLARGGWRDAIEADYTLDDPRAVADRAELFETLSVELGRLTTRLR